MTMSNICDYNYNPDKSLSTGWDWFQVARDLTNTKTHQRRNQVPVSAGQREKAKAQREARTHADIAAPGEWRIWWTQPVGLWWHTCFAAWLALTGLNLHPWNNGKLSQASSIPVNNEDSLIQLRQPFRDKAYWPVEEGSLKSGRFRRILILLDNHLLGDIVWGRYESQRMKYRKLQQLPVAPLI